MSSSSSCPPPDASQRGPARDTGPAGEHAWERGLRWWHLFFVTVFVGVAALALLDSDSGVRSKAAITALMAALALWYTLVGRRALKAGMAWLRVAYLAGALALFVPNYVMAPWTGFLLMALCPQCFMLLPHRRAVAACLTFNLVPVVMVLNSVGWRLDAVVGALVVGLLFTAYAAAFGSWIDRIIDQSRERAQLIEELEATRAELATANHEAGVLAERERLAAEIHDTLAQGFTSVLMLLQAAESEMDRDPAESRRHLALAQGTARENLAEARTLVAALAPARLENTSLVEALRRLVDDVGAALGIPAEFDVAGDPAPLPAGLEVVLLRAAQEALANARKHAGASHLTVRLDYGVGTCLEVTDDGSGFDPAALRHPASGRAPDATTTANGFGLRGMRARVEQVGGKLEIDSAPHLGTTTRVTLP